MAAGLVEYAPIVTILQQGPPGSGNPAPDAAPSSAVMGFAMVDPREPYSPNDPAGAIQAFYLNAKSKVVGAAPATAATNNIAAAQAAASGTPLTLVSATGAGITVMSAALNVRGSGNTVPSGSLAIDGVPSYHVMGQGFVSNMYNPAGGIARCVSVTANASATGGVIRFRGADYFGAPVTEDITAVAASTVNGKKAMKFVFSVTPTFTDAGHTYAVGTADIFGLHLRSDHFADIQAFFDGVLLAKATFTAAATATATATTGDVRGTVTPGVASDGTKLLEMFVGPTIGLINTSPLVNGLFGVPQFNA